MVKLQVRSISADAKTLPDFDCTLAFTCRDTNKIVGVAPLALERVVFYQPPDGGLNLAQCGLALSAKFDKESHRYVYNVIVAADNSIAITQSNADYEFIATVEAMPMFGKRK